MSAILFQESVLQAGDPLQPLLSQLPSPGSHLATPALFEALVQKYHHNRYSIFTQASSSKVAHDVFVAGKEREAVRLALERTLDRLGGGDITVWQTRSALWKTIELWGGYMEREPSWSRLLDSETRATEQALNSGDPSIVGTLLGTLSPVAHHTIAKSLISSLLRFFHLTHSLPTFFELILDALDGLFTPDLPEEIIISLYHLTLGGPLTSESIRQEIDQSLRSTLGGKGRSNIWDQILQSLVDRITPHLQPQPVGKKRKRSSSPSARSAALIGIHTRLISYCLLSSGTSHTIGSSLQSVKELSALIEDWPIRNDTDTSFSAAVTESGRVRVARNVESLTLVISAITVPGLHRSAIPELSIESLNRLATLIAQRVTKDSLLFTSGVFWELPNVRVTEGDSVGSILRNIKVLRRAVEVAADGNEAAISLFAKLINLIELGKPGLVAKFFSVVMRKEVQGILPKLLNLYSSVKTQPVPAVDNLDAIDTRNVLCTAGRWLGTEDPAALRAAIDASLSSSANDDIIKFFERITEDKAFALHHNDVVRLFPIITRLLDHQSLNSNINVLIALSRRRPDLILANLPEIVDILSIMFKTLQRSRKLPSPTSDESQHLSRLLVALTQMRLKTHETSPLAKHIPAILVAYVRAAADLHVGYTPSVRRDLEPGLYALCNLATAGGRAHARGREGEGLGTPFGLGEGSGGEGERELWADLWQNWSKSRYMGQG
ncbi:hypothetical protein V866_005336 [Kwoniella sp. B9012]